MEWTSVLYGVQGAAYRIAFTGGGTGRWGNTPCCVALDGNLAVNCSATPPGPRTGTLTHGLTLVLVGTEWVKGFTQAFALAEKNACNAHKSISMYSDSVRSWMGVTFASSFKFGR